MSPQQGPSEEQFKRLQQQQDRIDGLDYAVDGKVDLEGEDTEQLTETYIEKVNRLQGRLHRLGHLIDVHAHMESPHWKDVEEACTKETTNLVAYLSTVDRENVVKKREEFEAKIEAAVQKLQKKKEKLIEIDKDPELRETTQNVFMKWLGTSTKTAEVKEFAWASLTNPNNTVELLRELPKIDARLTLFSQLPKDVADQFLVVPIRRVLAEVFAHGNIQQSVNHILLTDKIEKAAVLAHQESIDQGKNLSEHVLALQKRKIAQAKRIAEYARKGSEQENAEYMMSQALGIYNSIEKEKAILDKALGAQQDRSKQLDLALIAFDAEQALNAGRTEEGERMYLQAHERYGDELRERVAKSKIYSLTLGWGIWKRTLRFKSKIDDEGKESIAHWSPDSPYGTEHERWFDFETLKVPGERNPLSVRFLSVIRNLREGENDAAYLMGMGAKESTNTEIGYGDYQDQDLSAKMNEAERSLRDAGQFSEFEQSLYDEKYDEAWEQAIANQRSVAENAEDNSALEILDQVLARSAFEMGRAKTEMVRGERVYVIPLRFPDGRNIPLRCNTHANTLLGKIRSMGARPVILDGNLFTAQGGISIKGPSDIGYADEHGNLYQWDGAKLDLASLSPSIRQVAEKQIYRTRSFAVEDIPPGIHTLMHGTQEDLSKSAKLVNIRTQAGKFYRGVDASQVWSLLHKFRPGMTLVLKHDLPEQDITIKRGDDIWTYNEKPYVLKESDLAYAEVKDGTLILHDIAIAKRKIIHTRGQPLAWIKDTDIHLSVVSEMPMQSVDTEREKASRDVMRAARKDPHIHYVRRVAATMQDSMESLQALYSGGIESDKRQASFVEFSRSQARPLLALLNSATTKENALKARARLKQLKESRFGMAEGGGDTEIAQEIDALESFLKVIDDNSHGGMKFVLRQIISAADFDPQTWAKWWRDEAPAMLIAIAIAVAVTVTVVMTWGAAAPLWGGVAGAAAPLWAISAAGAAGGVVGSEFGQEFSRCIRGWQEVELNTGGSLTGQWARGQKIYNPSTGKYEQRQLTEHVLSPLGKQFAFGFAMTFATMGLGKGIARVVSAGMDKCTWLQYLKPSPGVNASLTKIFRELGRLKDRLSSVKDSLEKRMWGKYLGEFLEELFEETALEKGAQVALSMLNEQLGCLNSVSLVALQNLVTLRRAKRGINITNGKATYSDKTQAIQFLQSESYTVIERDGILVATLGEDIAFEVHSENAAKGIGRAREAKELLRRAKTGKDSANALIELREFLSSKEAASLSRAERIEIGEALLGHSIKADQPLDPEEAKLLKEAGFPLRSGKKAPVESEHDMSAEAEIALGQAMEFAKARDIENLKQYCKTHDVSETERIALTRELYGDEYQEGMGELVHELHENHPSRIDSREASDVAANAVKLRRLPQRLEAEFDITADQAQRLAMLALDSGLAGNATEQNEAQVPQRSVETVMQEHNVIIVHGMSEYVPENNSILREDGSVTLETKLRIILGTAPPLSTSTISEGDARDNIWHEEGVIIVGGNIESAHPADAGTVAMNLQERDAGNGDTQFQRDPDRAIADAIEHRNNRNEFVVSQPEVAGIYFHEEGIKKRIGFKGELYKKYTDLGERYNLPVYCLFNGVPHHFTITQEREKAEFGPSEDINVLNIGEPVSTETLMSARRPLTGEQREAIVAETMREQPFDPLKLGIEEAKWMNEGEIGGEIFAMTHALENISDAGEETTYQPWPEEAGEIVVVPQGEAIRVIHESEINGRKIQHFIWQDKLCVRIRAKNVAKASKEVSSDPAVRVHVGLENWSRDFVNKFKSREEFLTHAEERAQALVKELQTSPPDQGTRKDAVELSYKLYGFARAAESAGDLDGAQRARSIAEDLGISTQQQYDELHERRMRDGRFIVTREDLGLSSTAETEISLDEAMESASRGDIENVKDYCRTHEVDRETRIHLTQDLLGDQYIEGMGELVDDAHSKYPGEIDAKKSEDAVSKNTAKFLMIMRGMQELGTPDADAKEMTQQVMDAGLAGKPPPPPPRKKRTTQGPPPVPSPVQRNTRRPRTPAQTTPPSPPSQLPGRGNQDTQNVRPPPFQDAARGPRPRGQTPRIPGQPPMQRNAQASSERAKPLSLQEIMAGKPVIMERSDGSLDPGWTYSQTVRGSDGSPVLEFTKPLVKDGERYIGTRSATLDQLQQWERNHANQQGPNEQLTIQQTLQNLVNDPELNLSFLDSDSTGGQNYVRLAHQMTIWENSQRPDSFDADIESFIHKLQERGFTDIERGNSNGMVSCKVTIGGREITFVFIPSPIPQNILTEIYRTPEGKALVEQISLKADHEHGKFSFEPQSGNAQLLSDFLTSHGYKVSIDEADMLYGDGVDGDGVDVVAVRGDDSISFTERWESNVKQEERFANEMKELDVAQEIQNALPPVPEGHVRIYRGIQGEYVPARGLSEAEKLEMRLLTEKDATGNLSETDTERLGELQHHNRIEMGGDLLSQVIRVYGDEPGTTLLYADIPYSALATNGVSEETPVHYENRDDHYYFTPPPGYANWQVIPPELIARSMGVVASAQSNAAATKPEPPPVQGRQTPPPAPTQLPGRGNQDTQNVQPSLVQDAQPRRTIRMDRITRDPVANQRQSSPDAPEAAETLDTSAKYFLYRTEDGKWSIGEKVNRRSNEITIADVNTRKYTRVDLRDADAVARTRIQNMPQQNFEPGDRVYLPQYHQSDGKYCTIVERSGPETFMVQTLQGRRMETIKESTMIKVDSEGNALFETEGNQEASSAAVESDISLERAMEFAKNGDTEQVKQYCKTHDISESERIQLAEALLDHPLEGEQAPALIAAHEVGQDEAGEDGTPARIDNYTDEQKFRKGRRLMENKAFASDEAQLLLDAGLAGTPPPPPPPPMRPSQAERRKTAPVFRYGTGNKLQEVAIDDMTLTHGMEVVLLAAGETAMKSGTERKGAPIPPGRYTVEFIFPPTGGGKQIPTLKPINPEPGDANVNFTIDFRNTDVELSNVASTPVAQIEYEKRDRRPGLKVEMKHRPGTQTDVPPGIYTLEIEYTYAGGDMVWMLRSEDGSISSKFDEANMDLLRPEGWYPTRNDSCTVTSGSNQLHFQDDERNLHDLDPALLATRCFVIEGEGIVRILVLRSENHWVLNTPQGNLDTPEDISLSDLASQGKQLRFLARYKNASAEELQQEITDIRGAIADLEFTEAIDDKTVLELAREYGGQTFDPPTVTEFFPGSGKKLNVPQDLIARIEELNFQSDAFSEESKTALLVRLLCPASSERTAAIDFLLGRSAETVVERFPVGSTPEHFVEQTETHIEQGKLTWTTAQTVRDSLQNNLDAETNRYVDRLLHEVVDMEALEQQGNVDEAALRQLRFVLYRYAKSHTDLTQEAEDQFSDLIQEAAKGLPTNQTVVSDISVDMDAMRTLVTSMQEHPPKLFYHVVDVHTEGHDGKGHWVPREHLMQPPYSGDEGMRRYLIVGIKIEDEGSGYDSVLTMFYDSDKTDVPELRGTYGEGAKMSEVHLLRQGADVELQSRHHMADQGKDMLWYCKPGLSGDQKLTMEGDRAVVESTEERGSSMTIGIRNADPTFQAEFRRNIDPRDPNGLAANSLDYSEARYLYPVVELETAEGSTLASMGVSMEQKPHMQYVQGLRVEDTADSRNWLFSYNFLDKSVLSGRDRNQFEASKARERIASFWQKVDSPELCQELAKRVLDSETSNSPEGNALSEILESDGLYKSLYGIERTPQQQRSREAVLDVMPEILGIQPGKNVVIRASEAQESKNSEYLKILKNQGYTIIEVHQYLNQNLFSELTERSNQAFEIVTFFRAKEEYRESIETLQDDNAEVTQVRPVVESALEGLDAIISHAGMEGAGTIAPTVRYVATLDRWSEAPIEAVYDYTSEQFTLLIRPDLIIRSMDAEGRGQDFWRRRIQVEILSTLGRETAHSNRNSALQHSQHLADTLNDKGVHDGVLEAEAMPSAFDHQVESTGIAEAILAELSEESAQLTETEQNAMEAYDTASSFSASLDALENVWNQLESFPEAEQEAIVKILRHRFVCENGEVGYFTVDTTKKLRFHRQQLSDLQPIGNIDGSNVYSINDSLIVPSTDVIPSNGLITIQGTYKYLCHNGELLFYQGIGDVPRGNAAFGSSVKFDRAECAGVLHNGCYAIYTTVQDTQEKLDRVRESIEEITIETMGEGDLPSTEFTNGRKSTDFSTNYGKGEWEKPHRIFEDIAQNHTDEGQPEESFEVLRGSERAWVEGASLLPGDRIVGYRIRDRGSGYPPDNIATVGRSTKNSPLTAGKYGEGQKMIAAGAARKGLELQYSSLSTHDGNTIRWTATANTEDQKVYRSDGRSETRQRVVFDVESNDAQDTSWTSETCIRLPDSATTTEDAELEQWFATIDPRNVDERGNRGLGRYVRTFREGNEQLTEVVDMGYMKILLNEPGAIYENGILIGHDSELALGYDIPDVTKGRDRNIWMAGKLHTYVAHALRNTRDPRVLEALGAALKEKYGEQMLAGEEPKIEEWDASLGLMNTGAHLPSLPLWKQAYSRLFPGRMLHSDTGLQQKRDALAQELRNNPAVAHELHRVDMALANVNHINRDLIISVDAGQYPGLSRIMTTAEDQIQRLAKQKVEVEESVMYHLQNVTASSAQVISNAIEQMRSTPEGEVTFRCLITGLDPFAVEGADELVSERVAQIEERLAFWTDAARLEEQPGSLYVSPSAAGYHGLSEPYSIGINEMLLDPENRNKLIGTLRHELLHSITGEHDYTPEFVIMILELAEQNRLSAQSPRQGPPPPPPPPRR